MPKKQLEVNIPQSNLSYRWQDGSNDSRCKVTQPGTYWLEVEQEGCKVSDTINIVGVKEPSFLDTSLCKGIPVDIMLYAPDVPSGTVVQWSTGSSASSIQITDSGLYWLNLIQPPCILSDTAYIELEACECFTYIPNAFSPNGDGINDYFLPVIEYDCPVKGYILSIYNRFGERVFLTNDTQRGWDGKYKGLSADAGTYFYKVLFIGGTRQRNYYFKGDISLIR
jgi:gliding motility-associated-like protein